ncbi:hypothetical protein KI387_043559, partial [Taxus chinensis]
LLENLNILVPSISIFHQLATRGVRWLFSSQASSNLKGGFLTFTMWLALNRRGL